MSKKNNKKPKVVFENRGLEVSNLGKRYKNRPILRGINLQVKKGEIVGLLGPNGAGKTTCFYSIMGLINPDYGKIKFNGIDITNYPVHLRARISLGYLQQETSIFRGMTVEQNIISVLETVEKDKEKIKTILEETLIEFSVSHLRRVPAITLSGGERRRVEIARALASQPSFLLLDEPLAGIDPIAVSEINDLVLQIKQKKVGILITDHNVRDTLKVVDTAFIIHDGKILKSGSPKEIVNDSGVKQVYLGKKFKI